MRNLLFPIPKGLNDTSVSCGLYYLRGSVVACAFAFFWLCHLFCCIVVKTISSLSLLSLFAFLRLKPTIAPTVIKLAIPVTNVFHNILLILY